MLTNLKTFPKHEETFTDGEEHDWVIRVLEWKMQIEQELKTKRDITIKNRIEIQSKQDLLHNTMKIVALVEIGTIEEIPGEQ
jgi:hypothetical protein